jgi:hypothetical protein
MTTVDKNEKEAKNRVMIRDYLAMPSVPISLSSRLSSKNAIKLDTIIFIFVAWNRILVSGIQLELRISNRTTMQQAGGDKRNLTFHWLENCHSAELRHNELNRGYRYHRHSLIINKTIFSLFQ